MRMTENPVALIGFMGSGKTTVGKILSRLLSAEFIDTDEQVEKKLKMSISRIFDNYGEAYFREAERNLLVELLRSGRRMVLSVGGGLPAYRDNMEILNRNALTVYLECDFETLWKRIAGDSARPLLRLGKDAVRRLFEERKPFYEKAKLKLRTDLLSPSECAEEIARLLRSF